MRKTSALLFVLLVFALPAFGATHPNPSQKQRELIEEMMKVTNMEKMEKEMFDAIFAQMQEEILREAGGDAAGQAEAKWKFERFRELLGKANIHEVTRELYMDVYAKYLTESELADLVAFYRTPTGQKSIQVMPQLMTETMQRSGATLGPKIQEVYHQVEKESDLRQPWKKTIARIETLGSYLEMHAGEHDGLYPEGDVDALATLFDDETIKDDVWGHELAYVLSNDRQHYRIVSAGADGIFDWDSRRIAEKTAGAEMRLRDRLEDDIIYADGDFVQLPKVAAPKE
ncbi:MAG TPA: DUF2059 domain-containing protein [Thermoanaerobaculia bacterium]|jgi:hypothetical protein